MYRYNPLDCEHRERALLDNKFIIVDVTAQNYELIWLWNSIVYDKHIHIFKY